MQDALSWGALIGSAASIIALVKFWVDIGRYQERIDVVDKTLADFSERGTHTSQVAQSMATAALAKAELANSALHEARVEFARDYVSHKDLADIRTELRGMNDRLDRILEKFTERGKGI